MLAFFQNLPIYRYIAEYYKNRRPLKMSDSNEDQEPPAAKRSRLDTVEVYSFKARRFELAHSDGGIKSEPYARSGHRILCRDDAFYAIGGYDAHSTLYNYPAVRRLDERMYKEMWMFDFFSRRFKKLSVENLPDQMASFAISRSNRLIFLYGGTAIPFGSSVGKHVSIAQMDDNADRVKFEPLCSKSEPQPQKLYGQAMVVYGLDLYTFGGTDGTRYCGDLFHLDLCTKEWTSLFHYTDETQIAPKPRYRHEMVAYNGSLYVMGGGRGHLRSYPLSEIWAYSIEKKRWTKHITQPDITVEENSGYPEPRRCHGCVQDHANPALVYVNCGLLEADMLADTWRIDLDTMTWKFLKTLTLPNGTYFHGCDLAPNGRMVVFGGLTDAMNPHRRTSAVYTAWLNVPQLKEMAWEAVGKYFRDGVFDMATLEDARLPSMFAARLRKYIRHYSQSK